MDALETLILTTQNIRKQDKWSKWQGNQPVGLPHKSEAEEIVLQDLVGCSNSGKYGWLIEGMLIK
jgi:hypothetical protein